MTISVRRTTLRDEVIKADPDWVRTRRRITEYEFSNGRRFEANYDARGIYGDGLDSGDMDNPPS